MSLPQTTRRWPRHQVDLPVRIVTLNGMLTTPVPGRGSEISRAGMALRARIGLKPGDLLQLQFPTSSPLRVTAVVRNRTGDRLGLEFLSQLPPDDKGLDRPTRRPNADFNGSAELSESVPNVCNLQTVYARLRQKQQELKQVQREIEALHMAILLLADDDKELSDCLGRIVRHRAQELGTCGLDDSRTYLKRQHLLNTHRTQIGP